MGFFDFLRDKTLEADLELQHPKLGKLVYEEEGWWKGQLTHGEYEIEISINGNENGVDFGLDEICVYAVNNFSEFHEKAHVSLKQTVSDYKIPTPLEFTLSGIFNIWKEGDKEGFTIGFNDNHDPYKLWRVEFENGKATGCGYDD